MTAGRTELRTTSTAPVSEIKMADNDRHTNTANAALGVSVGALVGSLLGVAVLPVAGLVVAPLTAAVVGGVIGNYAKRIAARFE